MLAGFGTLWLEPTPSSRGGFAWLALSDGNGLDAISTGVDSSAAARQARREPLRASQRHPGGRPRAAECGAFEFVGGRTRMGLTQARERRSAVDAPLRPTPWAPEAQVAALSVTQRRRRVTNHGRRRLAQAGGWARGRRKTRASRRPTRAGCAAAMLGGDRGGPLRSDSNRIDEYLHRVLHDAVRGQPLLVALECGLPPEPSLV